MTTRHAPPRRGYALLFVMLLMIALGVVVSGLLSALAQTVASSKAAHEDLQQMYGCDGAVRLALAEARRHSGDVDNTRLQASLGLLSAALASDVNPRTGRPYADLSSIRAESATRAVLTSATLPFMGMQYVEEGNRITVAANTAGGRGRACQADAPNRRRTMSYFQFALASTDVLGNPTGTQSIAGTAGHVFVLTHGMPAGLPWGMPGIGEAIDGAMQHAPQPGRQSMDGSGRRCGHCRRETRDALPNRRRRRVE